MASISLPPPNHPFVDLQTGKVDDAWYRAISQLTNGTNAALTSPVAIADGGTGSTSATAAFNALAPSTVPGTITYLTSSGWATLAPGTTAQFLESGSTPSWAAVRSPLAYASVAFGTSYALEGTPFNVASVSSGGVGVVTVNFTAGLASSAYVVAGSVNNSTGDNYSIHHRARTTAAFTALIAFGPGAVDSGFDIIVF